MMTDTRKAILSELANISAASVFCRNPEQRQRYENRIAELNAALKELDAAEKAHQQLEGQLAGPDAYHYVRPKSYKHAERMHEIAVEEHAQKAKQYNQRPDDSFGVLYLTRAEIEKLIVVLDAVAQRGGLQSTANMLYGISNRLKVIRGDMETKKPSGS